MKVNMPVTQREQNIKDSISIVSKTDTKGIITYVNRDFIEVSGFTEDELIGKNHNIVRHPDMPPEAFADLWETLKAGKPWIGIVKNRCKNGRWLAISQCVKKLHVCKLMVRWSFTVVLGVSKTLQQPCQENCALL